MENAGVINMQNKRTDPKDVSDEIRLWSRAGSFDPRKREECSLWIGYCTPGGYPMLTRQDGTKVYAHRLSWELNNHQKIPKGYEVCHVCPGPNGPQRSCIRPDHLIAAPPSENAAHRKKDLKEGRTESLERLNDDDAVAIRHLAATERFSQGDISDFFYGTRKGQPIIQRIISGRSYKKAGGPIKSKGRGKKPKRRKK